MAGHVSLSGGNSTPPLTNGLVFQPVLLPKMVVCNSLCLFVHLLWSCNRELYSIAINGIILQLDGFIGFLLTSLTLSQVSLHPGLWQANPKFLIVHCRQENGANVSPNYSNFYYWLILVVGLSTFIQNSFFFFFFLDIRYQMLKTICFTNIPFPNTYSPENLNGTPRIKNKEHNWLVVHFLHTSKNDEEDKIPSNHLKKRTFLITNPVSVNMLTFKPWHIHIIPV